MLAAEKKYKPYLQEPPPPPPKRKRPILFFFLILTILGFYAHWKGVDFLEIDEHGNVRLSAKRQRSLDNRLMRLNDPHQYALLAGKDGFYPCFNCAQDSLIFLHRGDTWKFGTTYSNRRYSNAWLENMRLQYKIEYRGRIEDCLIKEAEKIFNYATSPENLKRDTPLIRPPGNKNDQ